VVAATGFGSLPGGAIAAGGAATYGFGTALNLLSDATQFALGDNSAGAGLLSGGSILIRNPFGQVVVNQMLQNITDRTVPNPCD
jgi:hypothetical protein